MKRAMLLQFFLLAAPCAAAPTVHMGYASYQGYHDDTYGLNVWKSIRYAAPPTGKLRWQAPQPPIRAGNGSQITLAVDQPPLCPQTGPYGVPDVYGFPSALGDEDCLFLNVYAAPNATNLPVLVWIHGGGYGDFGAEYDPSVLINTNDNGFIAVEMQYRLGAFGYLASDDVKTYGQLNAGLLDQRFALEWVQQHISKFGGDPGRVTVGGESSGAGSVMLHSLAHGGRDSGLFNNLIAASPYSPPIYAYNDTVPSSYYYAFAQQAGCGGGGGDVVQNGSTAAVFECLVAADSETLQYASGNVSEYYGGGQRSFGSWAFVPVVDGEYIQERPATQLGRGAVSGQRILVGSNANDGTPLTDPNVDTREKYDAFVATSFPLFTSHDIAQLNAVYQINKSAPGDAGIRFDTLGTQGPTALVQSEMATGLQQTVFNLQSETTFACPAQWLAEAFSLSSSSSKTNTQAFKYQYSVTPAYHGADLSAYFATASTTVPNTDFRHAFQRIWGNFIMHDTPVIPLADAAAGYANATVPVVADGEDMMMAWPAYSEAAMNMMMDLNTTGGVLTETVVTANLSYFERSGAGIVNTFRLADARAWEGGRGARCDFWRAVSARVPQ